MNRVDVLRMIYRRAADGTIFIIPLHLEPCAVPERLRKWQWVDLFSADGYQKLVKALKRRAASLRAASD